MKVAVTWIWGLLWYVIGVALSRSVDGFDDLSATESLLSGLGTDATSSSPAKQRMVPLTLIPGAAAKGAVCLDGTPPGYHLDRGSGSGVNSWIIHLEGGGWCNNVQTCVSRKTTRHGSSNFMEKQLAFTGILSNKAKENPDFFNWNRVKLRYCDGASFAGEGQDEANQLNFRGQRIWSVIMEELMAEGMKNAEQALLSGCSAGGLASILHCDEFGDLFPKTTKVKCLSDAGLFLDAIDVGGGRTLRNMYKGVVSLQKGQLSFCFSCSSAFDLRFLSSGINLYYAVGSGKESAKYLCTSQMDPTSCFFPQNLVAKIKTPVFLLNSAYDLWQIHESLATPNADPHGYWKECRQHHAQCNASQIQFLQDFRVQMLNAINVFSKSQKNGLFINSCFAHCQSEGQDSWFADNSPVISDKAIAVSVGDWYFNRTTVKSVDCAYPCDKSCLDASQ
ncbi:hypothetical protein SLEP1_g4508 [Rubroshorea leprosula]|uniref:Pectin acetylesterase n=1 Tax=Rubroshorea leprosula TaxID=152421 RepID=A0AAV5HT87_9ROSI|nr:hypothetical protein SLEP1_g4508 [Rubroshorea leprosula]